MAKMANVSVKKKLLFLVLCLASVTQGMYSTYFVSILTTIERIYQIKSKTAGAILSATEIGQIIGSPLIAYYGGRGNKPKWIAACMTFTALAALAATTPHFMLTSRQQVMKNVLISPPASASNAPHKALHHIKAIHDKNISTSPPISIQVLSTKQDHLCHVDLSIPPKEDTFQHQALRAQNQQYTSSEDPIGKPDAPDRQFSTQTMLIVFFICLLAIGFGSTAVTTLGIPFIDDIVTKEESPLYLGLTIGLRIFGPALGFLLGSVCIGLSSSDVFSQDNNPNQKTNESIDTNRPAQEKYDASDSAWWLGLVIISIPLICLAVPMYYLSFVVAERDRRKRNCHDFEGITYQAAEDHDIGGSSDLQTHMLAAAAAVNLGLNTGAQLDVSSNRTSCSSELRSSCSHDTLQDNDRSHHNQQVMTPSQLQQLSPTNYKSSKSILGSNFVRNVALDRPMLTSDSIIGKVGFGDSYDHRLEHNRSLLTNLMITGKNNSIKTTNDWCTSTASIIVDSSNAGLNQQSTSFTSDRPINIQHLSSPASSTISSSAAVVTAAAPPTTTTGSLSSSYSHQSTFDLSSTVSRLIRNKLLLLRMLSGVLHILPIAGFYTFLPKYLIEQYQLTSSSASAISGLAGILFVGLGAFFGGTVVRIWNINSKMMTKWIAASSLFYAIGMIIMMNLSCKQGHQTIYYDSTIATPIASATTTQTISAGYDSVLTQAAQCLSRCKCSSSVYNPVCANGTTFMSPCLAGCKSYSVADDKIIYEECGGCPIGNGTSSVSSDSVGNQLGPSDHVNLNVAIHGHCPLICDNLKWYIIVFSIFTLIHSSSEAGSMMFNLRCVAQSDRTLALGLITLTSSLFGNIPCSIIYGSLIDLTCAHWDILPAEGALTTINVGTNGELPQIASAAQLKGACRTYHDDLFRIYLHGITAAIMLLAFAVDCIILRRSEEVDFYSDADSTKPESVRYGIQKSTETI